MSSTLESYELIRFAESFEARLSTAEEMLAGRQGLEEEKQWLATALDRVHTARVPASGLIERVKDLPELEEAREEFTFDQQGRWVDALEKLHAGITFTASSRAPVIEALFPNLKFPQLRRAPRELVTEFATSYERRFKSSYVTRIFSREDFAMVRPVVEQVASTYAAWLASLAPTPLAPEQEAALREELVTLGRKLDVALRQARLLAEAALVPVSGVFEAAGLTLKPRKRAGRGLALSSEEGLSDFPGEDAELGDGEEAEATGVDEDELGADADSDVTTDATVSEPAVPAEPAAEAASARAEGSTSAQGTASSEGSTGPARTEVRSGKRGRPRKDVPPPSPLPEEAGADTVASASTPVEEAAPRRGRRKKAEASAPTSENETP